MLNGEQFRRRVTISIALAYAGAPAVGLFFLVRVVEMISLAELALLVKGGLLPAYIGLTTVGITLYFRWYLEPVASFADGETSRDDALMRMRGFVSRFWVLFLLRHLTGAIIVLASLQMGLGLEPTSHNGVRLLGLTIMLSALVGLPTFVFILDFFAGTFSSHELREPIVRVRTRVFLTAVLVPVLINTSILEFLSARLGGSTATLVGLWLGLTTFAVVAALNLMRSLDRAVSELRSVSIRKRRALEVEPQQLRVRSMDEFGVLTCEYRDLLTNLKTHDTLLDARNQVLRAAHGGSNPDEVMCGQLEIVAERLGCERAVLIAMNMRERELKVLATSGESPSPCDLTWDPLETAVKSGELTTLPRGPGETSVVIALPLIETNEPDNRLVIVAWVSDASSHAAALQLLSQLNAELATTMRGALVAKEKAHLEKMLAESQRLETVGRLAAGVAHDFNNILTVIVGSAEALKDEVGGAAVASDVANEHSELILESSGRAAVLVRQLLTFSRQRIGPVEVFELNELVRNLDKFVRRLLPEDITLSVSLTTMRCHIRADRGHVEQAITNLVVNARDAISEGGEVRVETLCESDWAVLRVSDTGSGMSPEVVSHIFEPFYTTKPQEKGTGIGLATVHAVMKGCGGSIEVQSAPGSGTTMTARWPRVASTAEPRAKAASPAVVGKKLTVLLVEDDDAVRRVMKRVLSARGYEVLSASNGTEAIEIIEDETRHIDLLLSDIVMPDIKGTVVAATMATRRPDAKIILMTGWASEEVLAAAQESGSIVLNKPFGPNDIAKRIEDLFE